MNTLKKQIKKIYTLFEKYHSESHDVSEQFPVLQAKNLSSLLADDLEGYLYKAITTSGNVSDFKFFLPRVLELLVSAPNAFMIDVEIIFGKMQYAHITQWPETEQAAVRDLLMNCWKEKIISSPLSLYDAWLCGMGMLEYNMQECLRTWHSSPNATATNNFDEWKNNQVMSVNKKSVLQNAFWKNAPTAMEEVIRLVYTEGIFLTQQERDEIVARVQQGKAYLQGGFTSDTTWMQWCDKESGKCFERHYDQDQQEVVSDCTLSEVESMLRLHGMRVVKEM